MLALSNWIPFQIVTYSHFAFPFKETHINVHRFPSLPPSRCQVSANIFINRCHTSKLTMKNNEVSPKKGNNFDSALCVCVPSRKSARVYNKLVNHAAHTHTHRQRLTITSGFSLRLGVSLNSLQPEENFLSSCVYSSSYSWLRQFVVGLSDQIIN